MITKIDIPPDNRHEYIGLSSDTKPDYAGINSLFLELDTRDVYYYDGSDWQQVPDSGGGGGGGGGGNVPSGGTTGQLLAKASGTAYDTEWVTPLTKYEAEITLVAADWGSNTYVATVTGMTSTALVWASPKTRADAQIWVAAEVFNTAQGSGTLTFTCETTPTGNIDVNVVWLI